MADLLHVLSSTSKYKITPRTLKNIPVSGGIQLSVRDVKRFYESAQLLFSQHDKHGHIIIIIIIRYVCLLSQTFLPGTSLEPAVIPTTQTSSFTLHYFPYYM